MQMSIIFVLLILVGCKPVPATQPSPAVLTLEPPTATLISSKTPTTPSTTETPENTFTPIPAEEFTSTPTEILNSGEGVNAIILFIGDGMGIAQRTAARWISVGQNGTLAMDRMPVSGFIKTASANNPVTDSGAAGTAIATGIKTYNNLIGLNPEYLAVPTILEQAKEQGWSVGLVTSVQLSHATPAAFAAHVYHRDNMTEIARQVIELGVDVLLGGGEDEFLPSSEVGCYPERGERGDDRNLIAEAQAEGYTYVCNMEDLEDLDLENTNRLLGLFSDEGMYPPYVPSLAELTQMAIEVLSHNPNGFFLMVEGGQIDWVAHDNLADEVIRAVLWLDNAVEIGQAYADEQPKTLLIVTADHETGGMSVDLESSGSFREDGPFQLPDGTEFWVNWVNGYHSGVDVPVTAQGPYSDLLFGVHENTFVHEVMYRALMGIP
jgi:alkaline phosphatase